MNTDGRIICGSCQGRGLHGNIVCWVCAGKGKLPLQPSDVPALIIASSPEPKS